MELPGLNLKLMFWREQELSDERFDLSLPAFWRKANDRVPSRHFPGEAQNPGASRLVYHG